jgi:hypothetical protein
VEGRGAGCRGEIRGKGGLQGGSYSLENSECLTHQQQTRPFYGLRHLGGGWSLGGEGVLLARSTRLYRPRHERQRCCSVDRGMRHGASQAGVGAVFA